MHKPQPLPTLIQSQEVINYHKLTGDTVDLSTGEWVSDSVQALAQELKQHKQDKHYCEVLWLTRSGTLTQAVESFGQTVVAELTDIQQSVISARYRTARAYTEVIVPLLKDK